MTKPLIPFGWWPGHWGLKGTTRQIAQAEYELDGYELKQRLLEIHHINDGTLERRKIELMHEYNEIDKYAYDQRIAKLDNADETAQQLALLDVDLKHEKINQAEYDRKRADILKEPWVSMPKISWNPGSTNRTYFELDYNEYFIEYLKQNGYFGSEEEMLNTWMNDICGSILNDMAREDGQTFVQNRPQL